MADSNQLKRAEPIDLGNDDPFAELTRIMGFDPRVPVRQPAGEAAAPAPQAASSFDDEFDDDAFGIDLERELMGGLGRDMPEQAQQPEARALPAAEPVFDAPQASGAESPAAAAGHDADPFADLDLESILLDDSAYRDTAQGIEEPAPQAAEPDFGPVGTGPFALPSALEREEEIDTGFDAAMADVDVESDVAPAASAEYEDALATDDEEEVLFDEQAFEAGLAEDYDAPEGDDYASAAEESAYAPSAVDATAAFKDSDAQAYDEAPSGSWEPDYEGSVAAQVAEHEPDYAPVAAGSYDAQEDDAPAYDASMASSEADDRWAPRPFEAAPDDEALTLEDELAALLADPLGTEPVAEAAPIVGDALSEVAPEDDLADFEAQLARWDDGSHGDTAAYDENVSTEDAVEEIVSSAAADPYARGAETYERDLSPADYEYDDDAAYVDAGASEPAYAEDAPYDEDVAYADDAELEDDVAPEVTDTGVAVEAPAAAYDPFVELQDLADRVAGPRESSDPAPFRSLATPVAGASFTAAYPAATTYAPAASAYAPAAPAYASTASNWQAPVAVNDEPPAYGADATADEFESLEPLPAHDEAEGYDASSGYAAPEDYEESEGYEAAEDYDASAGYDAEAGDDAYGPAAPLNDNDVPDIATIDVPETAYAIDDDLDIPELAHEDDAALAAAFDEFEHELAVAYGDPAMADDLSYVRNERAAPSEASSPYAATGAAAAVAAASLAARKPAEDHLASYGYDAGQPAQRPMPVSAGTADETDGFDRLPYDQELDDALAVPAYEERRAGPQRRGMMIAAAVGGVALLGAVGAFMISFGDSGTDVPVVVRADDSPIKVRPENPGGTVVPNQDSKVYERVAEGAAPTALTQEKLISAAEEPLDVTAQGESLPMMSDPDAAVDDVSEAIAKGEDRVAPSAEQASVEAAEVAAVAPRRVRTMIVKPDGSLVPREEAEPIEVAAPAAQPGAEAMPIEPAATAPEAPAAAGEAPLPAPTTAPAELAAAPAQPEAPATAPTQTAAPQEVASIPETGPLAPSRPADQPLDVVGEVKADQVAAASGAAAAGAWSMQIASQPTEQAAKASYDDLSRRYAGVLGGKGVTIVKADIAGKGTYYRVRVPAGSRNEAISLCERYKAAGGNCFVSK